MYGFNESDLAVQFIVRKGYPEKWFIPFPTLRIPPKKKPSACCANCKNAACIASSS